VLTSWAALEGRIAEALQRLSRATKTELAAVAVALAAEAVGSIVE
jgi:hypothetical protein